MSASSPPGMKSQQLFTPLKVGHANLTHRIALAPLTRFRADDQHVHFDIAKEYYEQRASTPGTLLITEATFISPRASGMDNVPGIWNAAQVAAWRSVTDAVHAKGCYIYCQLWALGRRAELAILAREEGGPYAVVSASAVPTQPGGHEPEPLTAEGIQVFIDDYVEATKNAIAAGFDGVEIHGANGYLIDQFLSEDLNHRNDEYGGSVEKRSRFGLEVTKAVIAAAGDSQKVAIRLSPWTDHGAASLGDRVPQFQHIISQLRPLGLAYLHLVESRISGDVSSGTYDTSQTRNDPLIREWGTDQPIILAGGFSPESAAQIADLYSDYQLLIAFGRYYISTPDLPFRIQHGLELNEYDRSTFYKKKSAVGYTDYPFHPQYTGLLKAKA
jgi:NADPH2 dehydrogenase